MKLPMDEAEDDVPGLEDAGYDFGPWPEIFGLLLVLGITLLMFTLADGHW